MGDSSLSAGGTQLMPWQESCAMDARIDFISELRSGLWTMTELCERYEVSRKTGYKWVARYASFGAAGLMERSHAPLRHGRSTPSHLVDAIVGLRHERPSWGPRKLIAKLAARHPESAWPAASTAGEILTRAGLVCGRRVQRRAPPRMGELTVPQHANHVWGVDHKGWVRLCDGARAEPLTMTDGFSRYLISVSATGSTAHDEAKPVFERAFREHGLPEVIRRQRHALRLDGDDRADRAVGMVDQAGHSARADRPRPSAAERPTRALPPHAARGHAAALRRPRRPGAPLPRLRPRLQRGAAARSSRSADACQRLSALAPRDARAASRTDLSGRGGCPQSPLHRRDQMARHSHLRLQHPHRRGSRRGRDRNRRLASPFLRGPDRRHRSPQTKTASCCRPRARGRQHDDPNRTMKNCHPSIRSVLLPIYPLDRGVLSQLR